MPSFLFPPIYLVAERVLASNHTGKLGAGVVLQPHLLDLTSLSRTTSEARGEISEQKSSDVCLKVKGDTVQKLQLGHLQLLLEDQVPELKGMKMFTTEQNDTVIVQISQSGKSCIWKDTSILVVANYKIM